MQHCASYQCWTIIQDFSEMSYTIAMQLCALMQLHGVTHSLSPYIEQNQTSQAIYSSQLQQPSTMLWLWRFLPALQTFLLGVTKLLETFRFQKFLCQHQHIEKNPRNQEAEIEKKRHLKRKELKQNKQGDSKQPQVTHIYLDREEQLNGRIRIYERTKIDQTLLLSIGNKH